jgi:hypothetical protein
MTMKLVCVFVFLQLLGATAVSSKAKSRPAPYQQHPTSNPTNDSAVLFVFPNGSARTEKAGVFQQGPHTVPCPVCGSTGILESLQTFWRHVDGSPILLCSALFAYVLAAVLITSYTRIF